MPLAVRRGLHRERARRDSGGGDKNSRCAGQGVEAADGNKLEQAAQHPHHRCL